MSKKCSFKEYLELFGVFLRIGAFTFGGGYAMIPLLQREVAQKRSWITDEDMLEIIAIAESTPGPIAINAATFIGLRKGGVLGSTLATLGVVLPSYLIIIALSFVINEVNDIKPVQYAFEGIRVGVLALVLKAFINMYKQFKKYLFSYIVAAAAFVLVAFLGVSVLPVIILCAAAGLTYTLVKNKRSAKKSVEDQQAVNTDDKSVADQQADNTDDKEVQ